MEFDRFENVKHRLDRNITGNRVRITFRLLRKKAQILNQSPFS